HQEAALPPQFFVFIPALRLKCAVERRWKRDCAIGVEIRFRKNCGGTVREKNPSAERAGAEKGKPVYGKRKGFAADRSGGTALEYALLVALIASLIVLGVASSGKEVSGALSDAASALGDGTAPEGAPPPDNSGDPAAPSPSPDPSPNSAPSDPAPGPSDPGASDPGASNPGAGEPPAGKPGKPQKPKKPKTNKKK
ncbi:MAG: Flp family type IVb pilin, partial [Parvularculaceae bacterium]